MKRTLISSIVAVLASTVLLGLVYPLAVTGIVQVIPTREVVLAEATHVGDARYFQPRPSQTDYSADATAFSNRGPNSSSAKYFYLEQIAAYRAMNDGAEPPMDAVTTSASGVDPDISHENAVIQARRIARVRSLPEAEVLALVGDDGHVNTTKLNEALDR
ncbi:potassium-transporting ATPase subunit C [Solirubrobacter phytolaccae]|uniref:Potassium-transporting ATPase subunit C n=1 Tax=Solirubrobacter phytolaccae TaxID=1404360 RepID=A0A9X3NB10_9ACTN|nr:potassium-transporting ATPase subunit C [Solirubrobacter phytolaccae]MDA0182804.1 potassium-transporting ATPase subunit C [Solirubrobacter phytolaccae]